MQPAKKAPTTFPSANSFSKEPKTKVKTKNFAMFKPMDENRKVDRAHVEKIKKSIKTNNLLEWRPILVNSKMEVLDGNHRLQACKELNLEIWYEIHDELTSIDIPVLQVAKSWTPMDYLMFYVKQDYEDYKKLDEFLKRHSMSLKVATGLLGGMNDNFYDHFRNGDFEFNESKLNSEKIELCDETVDYIREHNGTTISAYTKNAGFFRALYRLVNHEDFDIDNWRKKLSLLVGRIRIQPTHKDYLILLQGIYNYKTRDKIILLENKKDELIDPKSQFEE